MTPPFVLIAVYKTFDGFVQDSNILPAFRNKPIPGKLCTETQQHRRHTHREVFLAEYFFLNSLSVTQIKLKQYTMLCCANPFKTT